MLLIDTTPLKVVQIFITSLIGVFGLSSSLEGFLSVKMSVPVRVLMAAGGLMLIDPSLMTDVVGSTSDRGMLRMADRAEEENCIEKN